MNELTIKTLKGNEVKIEKTGEKKGTISIVVDGEVKSQEIYIWTPKGKSPQLSDMIESKGDYIVSIGTFSGGFTRFAISGASYKEIYNYLRVDNRTAEQKAEDNAVMDWAKARSEYQRLRAHSEYPDVVIAAERKVKETWENLKANYPEAVARIIEKDEKLDKMNREAYEKRTADSWASKNLD